jgi:hypothetical protein
MRGASCNDASEGFAYTFAYSKKQQKDEQSENTLDHDALVLLQFYVKVA